MWIGPNIYQYNGNGQPTEWGSSQNDYYSNTIEMEL